MPNGKSEMRREGGEHVFGKGRVTSSEYNLPRGFNCAMCGRGIRERKFGEGFKGCGALGGNPKGEKPLCQCCFYIIDQLIKHGQEAVLQAVTASRTLEIEVLTR